MLIGAYGNNYRNHLDVLVEKRAMQFYHIEDKHDYSVSGEPGEWIHNVDKHGYQYHTCSICGSVRPIPLGGGHVNYCPNCGREMKYTKHRIEDSETTLSTCPLESLL